MSAEYVLGSFPEFMLPLLPSQLSVIVFIWKNIKFFFFLLCFRIYVYWSNLRQLILIIWI